jgi:FkbM family methyltransferase
MRGAALSFLLQRIPEDWKRRIGVHLGAPDIRWSLRQLRSFGFNPSSVLDGGAFRGDWARACLSIFPQARITCIEPQDESQKSLRALASSNPNVQVIQTLLGARTSARMVFAGQGSGSSVLLDSGNARVSSMTTIDQLIKDGDCAPPELLKLDVQGYELEVLEGWNFEFERCQVIQCEISLLPLVPGAPMLEEVIAYMARRDFLMWDVDELIRAPSDGAVWQIDALFCRKDSPLRRERVWRSQP